MTHWLTPKARRLAAEYAEEAAAHTRMAMLFASVGGPVNEQRAESERQRAIRAGRVATIVQELCNLLDAAEAGRAA